MCGRIHDLKILPPYFAAVKRGDKPFEVRKDDRGFMPGDTLRLREWTPDEGYTGREVNRMVGYVMAGGMFGVESGYCVMAITP